MNGWFLFGGLVGIVVTIAFEVLVAFLFDLPSRGVEDVTPSPSEAVGRFTNVRTLTPQDSPRGNVVDIRLTSDTSPLDAGATTVGQALGVVLLALAFLAAMSFVGAVETWGLS